MLKRMAINIGGVSFIFAVIMILSSLSSILLGNVLPPDDLGEFVFIRMLVLFISPLAIWGQGIATTRYFSANDVRQFRWDVTFFRIMAVSIVLVFISVVVVFFVFHLSLYKLSGLFLGAVFYCATLFFSNLLRSQRRFNLAIFMFSGFRGVFFLFLVIVYFTGTITRYHAIFVYLGVIILMTLINACIAFRMVPRGTKLVPREMHTFGLILMGIDVSIVFMTSMDSMFIKKILGNSALALYQMTLVPGQVFRILNRAAKYVWVPEFARSQKVRFKAMNAGVAVVALILFAILMLAAHPILDFLFKGKYNSGVPLLRVFALVGVIRLFYSLTSSLIMGKLSHQALRYHLALNIVSLALYMFVLYHFLLAFGVFGAGLALLLLSVIRLLGSYAILFQFREQVQRPAAVPRANTGRIGIG
jgi:O-antigen/teichoic acid export membrane protein